ncbi:MAG: hypothetical protein KAR35_01435 [Candidatus Heimdallarchaeota archaeon]|nr:hypothetical protein [Candidatus Heimdallarchaeota archaeon]MCK5048018.1 hypothetical protein [Candidatus Heimdallarchaeota archaeon]
MSNDPDPITESLLVLTKYFHHNNTPYVIVGGVSVLVFGKTRMTLDIDIIVDHTKIDREDFITSLTENGFDINLLDLAGFDDHTHCSFFLKRGMFRIDMKGMYSQAEKESIEMAVETVFNNIKVKINHPINIILYKLLFGSEQDYEDALAVYVRMKDTIDHDHLKQKANQMDLGSQLSDFLENVNDLINS